MRKGEDKKEKKKEKEKGEESKEKKEKRRRERGGRERRREVVRAGLVLSLLLSLLLYYSLSPSLSSLLCSLLIIASFSYLFFFSPSLSPIPLSPPEERREGGWHSLFLPSPPSPFPTISHLNHFLIVGFPTSFLVKLQLKETKEQVDDDKKNQKDNKLEVKILSLSSPSSIIPHITKLSFKKWKVEYRGRKAGKYEVRIIVNGNQVAKEMVELAPASIHPNYSFFAGPPLSPFPIIAGKETHLTVEAKDEYGNECGPDVLSEISNFWLEMSGVATSGKDSGKTVTMREEIRCGEGEDGSLCLYFTPKLTGYWHCFLLLHNSIFTQWKSCVISKREKGEIKKHVRFKRCFFKATMGESIVWLLLTGRQFGIRTYLAGIIPKRLYTFPVRPSTLEKQIEVEVGNSTGFYVIADQINKLHIHCDQRNHFYATFAHLAYSKIGTTSQGFEEKREYLYSQLSRQHNQRPKQQLRICVNREDLLHSSLRSLRGKSGGQLKGELIVQFEGEAGIDMGGVGREFIDLLGKQLFHPHNSLFAPLAGSSALAEGAGVHPFSIYLHTARKKQKLKKKKKKKRALTRRSFIDIANFVPATENFLSEQKEKLREFVSTIQTQYGSDEFLEYYRFAGLIIAKCIYDTAVGNSHLVGVHFTRSFRKMLLGLPVHYSDFAVDDKDYYTSKIKYIAENDITDICEDLDMTFTEEIYNSDNELIEIVELQEDGANIRVTQQNKLLYLHLLAEFRLCKSVEAQVQKFREGFYSILDEDLISIFDESELELLFCGLPNIDFEDFRTNSQSFTGNPIDWFWIAVSEFTQEERAKLLQFITGSSQLPIGGFKELSQPITIVRSFTTTDSLPTAHTCFNRLDLPAYSSYESLYQKLHYAVTEGAEGFAYS
eukprot:CAMPEP_0174275398 /NCGR_PEP_ID=MMETSP0439-20130205/59802_1 /TAXON_ID=0 /ORGANISM="Stereomyxa ramosa, Strain Chinc5" /LENGTH=886 /DNA_ID=CAMNT_0015367497 /DNA_START=431 /DNA_END=3087 /DNA_ORIENTATION=-